MKTSVFAVFGAVALTVSALPANAAMPETELALMPTTVDVTLLNDGGKYVAIDMKHIDKGGTCRMDQDAIVMRVDAGTPSDKIRVRALMPQISSGGCPFMTEFEMPADQYGAAHKAFADKKEAADKKLSEMTKKIGDTWDDLFGTSKPKPKTELL